MVRARRPPGGGGARAGRMTMAIAAKTGRAREADPGPTSEGTTVQTGAGRAHALAERLIVELDEAWRRGERPRAEALLARYPELGAFPAAAVWVVYEEVRL